MHKQEIIIKKIFHRGEHRLGILFDYNPDLITTIKTLSDRRYSKTLSCWYVPYDIDHYKEVEALGMPLKRIGLSEFIQIKQIQPTPNLSQTKEWEIKKNNKLKHIQDDQKIAMNIMMDYMLNHWYPWYLINKYVDLVSKSPSKESPDLLRALRVLSLSTRS